MIKTLLAQVKEFKKASFLTPVFMILEVVVETMIPLVMADMIDNGVEAGNISYLYRKGAIMALLAVAGLVTGILGGKYGAYASSGFARNLRKAMYTNIQTFSFSNIDKFSTASLITRLTTDVTNLQNAYQMILRMCTRAPASLICAMAMAFMINARVASIYLIAVIFLGCFLVFIMKKATKYFREVFEKYDDLNASVQENISAVRVVKAYVREEYETTKFQKACNKVYEMFVRAEKLVVMNMPVMQFTVYACILGISWLGANMIVGGSLTTGELMSLLTYCMNILMSLMMLSMVFVMVTMSAASAERVTEVINETADLHDPQDPVMEVADGSIEFDHVDFIYPGSREPAIHDIDFTAYPGQTTAIIGSTGCGKSTIVNLIPRLYDVTKGSITLDGIDIRELSMKDLRQQIGFVPQKGVLFSGTIASNLRFGNAEATDAQVVQAAQIAQAEEFIEEKPEKYESPIAQGGTNVSGGQKQRLAIARAIAKHPRIFVFDDSFSALDLKTDAKLRKALSDTVQESTVIIVAQRISTILHADQILVLDEGEIVGKGTHEELMKHCTVYQEIAKSQMSAKELGLTDGEEGEYHE